MPAESRRACPSNLFVLELGECQEGMMQRGHEGRSSATPERAFPGLCVRAWARPSICGYAPLSQKSFKKVLTPEDEISYHTQTLLKRTRNFTREILCLSGASKHKTNKTTGRERTQQSMYPLNQLKTLVSCGRDPARSLPFRRGFLLIPLILAAFTLTQVQAAVDTPAPTAVLPNGQTADGA